MKRVLIIVPAYNERDNICNTINKILKYKKKSNYKLDYVIINDGSTDDTLLICKEKSYNFINLDNNLGIGGAVQTGYKYAYYNNYDIAIQFDGDGQHDIKYVDKLIKNIENNQCDMVIGSRFVGNVSNFKSTYTRRIGIKILSFLIKIFTKKTIKDVTSGYRAVNKKVINRFAKNYIFDYPEPITNLQLIKEGFIVKEIPVNMNERKFGSSSIRLFKSVYYMLNVGITMLVFGISNGGNK